MTTIPKELAKVIEENKHWITQDPVSFASWLYKRNKEVWLYVLKADYEELETKAHKTYSEPEGGHVESFIKALAVHGYEVEGEKLAKNYTVEIEAKIKSFMTCPHCGSKSVREAGEITIKCNDCYKTFIPIIK